MIWMVSGQAAGRCSYDPINGIHVPTVYEETGSQNIDVGKKYIDLEHANAYRMDDIYRNWGSFSQYNFVLCDVYAKASVRQEDGYADSVLPGGRLISFRIIFVLIWAAIRILSRTMISTTTGIMNDCWRQGI